MLSALQRRLAALVTEIPEAQDFVIAGGAALILQGQAQRVTTDLDYFARSPHAVDDLLPVVEARFSADGLSVERRQVTSGFARLAVSDGAENCQVDLGYDFRLRDPTLTPLGAVLSLEELAADKVLAVHGRAEARDYVDLHVLMKQFGTERPLQWALEKDPGFSTEIFAERLGRVDAMSRADFDITDIDLAVLRHDLSEWSRSLLGLELDTRTRRRERGVEPPGLGR